MRAADYLHDVGKLTIPSRILDKPGKLTREEMEIMRGHTYHTFHILNNGGSMPQVAEWAAFHHERLDGTGYPFHHGGKNLTLGARIMAVADIQAHYETPTRRDETSTPRTARARNTWPSARGLRLQLERFSVKRCPT